MTEEQPDNVDRHIDHNAETCDIPAHGSDDASQVTPPSSQTVPTSMATVPEMIGNYRILRVIGQGGMGTVYQAEQESPRRTVALKVIRAGFANERLLRRFEYEAQILGKLDHPGIATIFEAGTFNTGAGSQPYFAMEFVEGKLLTEYADEKNLGTRQRLELLARIAEAIQHAHQKGVIHRDLKPGNILVTDDGQVKILDFGVARATDADVQCATLQTDIGQLIGTIPYMSPEQALGDPEDIDTRSDVYALGVIAYQLLAGQMPYDLERKMIHEAVRVIQEDTPPPLSSINRVFRGDIQVIVGKALIKEKDRRYQTASDFANDIHRYLNHEPILARPPSTWYQLSKFMARNKALVAGAAVVLVVSVVGTIVSTSFAIGEAQQKQIAQENELAALDAQAIAEEQTIEAQRQQAIAQSINEFLNVRLLGSAAPDREGRDVLVRDMLFKAAQELNTNPPAIKRVEAALRLTIGRTYTGLGFYKESESHLRIAAQMWEQIDGSESLTLAEAMEALAFSLMRTNEFDEAYTLAQQVLENRKELLGEDDPLTIRAQGDVVMFEALQRGDIAGGFNNMALDMIRLAQGNNESRDDLRDRINNLILDLETLVAGGHFEQAIGLLDDEAKPFLASSMLRERVPYASASYSIMLAEQGMLRAAEAIALHAVKTSEEYLNPEHPYALHSLYAVSHVLTRQGRLDDAEPYLARYVIGKRFNLGDEHEETLNVIYLHARLLQAMGEYDQAELEFRETLDGRRRTLGDEHYDTLVSIYNLGKFFEMQGRYAQAEPYFREDLEICRRIHGNDHLETLLSIYNLSELFIQMQEFAKAEPLAIEYYENRFVTNGSQHHETLGGVGLLIRLYSDWDTIEPDAGHHTKADQWRAKQQESDNPDKPGEISEG